MKFNFGFLILITFAILFCVRLIIDVCMEL